MCVCNCVWRMSMTYEYTWVSAVCRIRIRELAELTDADQSIPTGSHRHAWSVPCSREYSERVFDSARSSSVALGFRASTATRFRSTVLGCARFSRKYGDSIPRAAISERFDIARTPIRQPSRLIRNRSIRIAVNAWCACRGGFHEGGPACRESLLVSAHERARVRRVSRRFSVEASSPPAIRGIFLIVAKTNCAHRRVSGTPRVTSRDNLRRNQSARRL